ncbi:regulator of G-protein signaling 12-like [Sardina pilchardus]|uniref:regulator of G-protein signaling 12-like n=1 Tax=Sardina pilchardus TaxID=27697 RepID=UPI002E0F2446
MRVPGQAAMTRGGWLDPCGQTGVKRVEMARGRAGYGFTLVGQRPCLLSGIVRGSPAEVIGLRPGDRVLSVNGTDVTDAPHETVVKLIGSFAGNLRLVVDDGGGEEEEEEGGCWEGAGAVPLPSPLLADAWSSDEELVVQSADRRGLWLKPNNASEIVKVPAHQPCHPFKVPKNNLTKERPVSEPDLSYFARWGLVKSNPDLLSDFETAALTSSDSVLAESIQSLDNLSLDSHTLNVAMVVGYINTSPLDMAAASSASSAAAARGEVVDEEEERLRCVHRCITQVSVEQSTHSVVMMHVLCDGVQLCDDAGATLASYPAERLVLGALCPEDPRFFGLVTIDSSDGPPPRTLCHVFFVDPELYRHEAHDSIRAHFGFQCTADPDSDASSGCLEFPQSPTGVLQFVSVLYRDMGDFVERLRARAERDGEDDQPISTRHSGSGDSGIGNVSPEETRGGGGHNALLSERWSLSMGHIPEHVPEHVWGDLRPLTPRHKLKQHHNNAFPGRARRCLLTDPLSGPPAALPDPVRVPPVGHDKTSPRPPPPPYPQDKAKTCHTFITPAVPNRRGSQRWPSVSIRARWQRSRPGDGAESATATAARPPASKSRTLPAGVSQIPANRFGDPNPDGLPPRAVTLYNEPVKKLFGWNQHNGHRNKDDREKLTDLGIIVWY